MKISKGKPSPLGITICENGVNFAVFSHNASAIDLCLFNESGTKEVARFALPERTGDIFHGFIEGNLNKITYGFRAHGEYNPQNGNKFDDSKLLLDPYSLELTSPLQFRHELANYGTDTANFVPKTKIVKPATFAHKIFRVNDDERIIYELNVKGFSALNPKIPEGLRGTLQGLGASQSVEYLKDLGINSVELMPCAAWIDERHLYEMGLKNYWGYNPVCLMAPDPKLAPNGWKDVKDCTKALNDAGIEVILDLVFNHSGESDENGPILSFRGLDNQSYYQLNKDNKNLYVNDTGTGNSFNCNHEMVTRLMLDTMRAWVQYGGISGFRFDLASVLARVEDKIDFKSRFLTTLEQDEVLKDCLLIAEPWDIGQDGYQMGQFPPRWFEWNDKFRDCLRGFWRGDNISTGELADFLCGYENIFKAKSLPKTINYITSHDGFTLKDLVSFQYKANIRNGENNNDGHNNNLSCNHGVEGETKDVNINALRRQHQKNLLATLLVSRGTPMITMGSEFGKSQYGNNNAYCQDNEISWLNFNEFDQDLFDFTKKLIAIRKSLKPLNKFDFLDDDSDDGLYPQISWLMPDGTAPTNNDWDTPKGKVIIACIYEPCLYEKGQRIIYALNRGEDAVEINLPINRDGYEWKSAFVDEIYNNKFNLNAFDTAILLEELSNNPILKNNELSDETLGNLCKIGGVSQSWWDIFGKENIVPKATIFAILQSMGINCASENGAKVWIKNYVDKFTLRPLPFYNSFSEKEVPELIFYTLDNAPLPNFTLKINGEGSFYREVKFSGDFKTGIASDKRIIRRYTIKLDRLNIGRYKITRDDYPDCVSSLTIAPQQCFLPPKQSYKGISAQLYSLKETPESVFGDFSCLHSLLESSKENGFEFLAINPLHALFACDRDLKSPYYPSDRRFIEPLYIPTPTENIQKSAYIDYKKVWDEKLEFLEEEFKNFIVDNDYIKYEIEHSPALDDFAVFEVLSEKFTPLKWQEWEEEFKNKEVSAIRKFTNDNQKRINFYKFLQYKAENELKSAIPEGIKIIRDLAVGAAPNGCENWCEQEFICQNLSIGAPPDPLGPQGQVWGLPPKNPLKMIENQFVNMANLFSINMKHAGALRIDHALGLMRQFWVPKGESGKNGTYVGFPFTHLLNELKFESYKNRCIIIGEDLGTVPPGFREQMEAAGCLSYKVLPFEKYDNKFKSSWEYPHIALACAATHDIPPLRGWWNGNDINERFSLGLYNDDDYQATLVERFKDRQALVELLINENLLPSENANEIPNELSPEIAAAIHCFINKTDCILKLTQIEDLAGEEISVNLPGTNNERPNWQKRVKLTINDIFSQSNPIGMKIINSLK